MQEGRQNGTVARCHCPMRLFLRSWSGHAAQHVCWLPADSPLWKAVGSRVGEEGGVNTRQPRFAACRRILCFGETCRASCYCHTGSNEVHVFSDESGFDVDMDVDVCGR